MNVAEFISSDIFPLKKTDTCEMALVFMQDWHTLHLPVTDDGHLIGYVTMDKLLEAESTDKVFNHLQPLTQLYTLKASHFFEAIKLFAETKFTCLAVCDADHLYEGAISINEVLTVYQKSSLSQPGAIVTLVMNPQDYSLAEIARVIEYNDCKIVQVFIQPDSGNPGKISVSLKLNKQSIAAVIHTLERYQYQIQSIHQMDELEADLNNRYDWLIKYLNT
jgi:CBS domain-containing protein